MKEIRWQQRFENYEKAFLLLNSPFEAKELADFSDLEQEGLVQRARNPSLSTSLHDASSAALTLSNSTPCS